MDVVDGNAIGGLLIDVFGTEMTAANSTCGTCGTTRPVAELVVYRRAPGTVVRCRTCGSVLMVFVNVHDVTCVDLAGLASLGQSETGLWRAAGLCRHTQKRDIMDITGKTALVTGANRGLGRQLAAQLRDRGARVYAAARDPHAVDLAGVTPIALDIADPAQVAAAAQAASGVTILVNNAGASTGSSLLTGDLAAIRLEMDTHFFGTLAVTRAFAPQLAAHGSSAVLNILSALSWLSIPRSGAYCAAKSAEWSLTNALRLELAAQGTRVTALHVAYMDTDMTRHLDVPKSDPAAVAKLAIDGIAAGDAEIIADETTRHVLAGLSTGVAGLYPQLA